MLAMKGIESGPLTPTDGSSDTRRGLIVIHAALGVGLLLCPRCLLPVSRGAPLRVLVGTAKVLGGRHLAEAAALSLHPDHPPPQWSIAVDGLHGLSMLAIARFSARSHRAASASAIVALSLATLAAYERRSPAGRFR